MHMRSSKADLSLFWPHMSFRRIFSCEGLNLYIFIHIIIIPLPDTRNYAVHTVRHQ